MAADEEGFLYPVIDREACTNCQLCDSVCVFLNNNEKRNPVKVYAARHKNREIQRTSSSGGIFTLLAEQIIDSDGVVFGARFNDHWEIVHDFTEKKEGLIAFRGSKYVQSRMGESYTRVKEFLIDGREVLFSGTPCQVAGIRKYLGKNYRNLLTVDFVCHGVPSAKVFNKYLDELFSKQIKKEKLRHFDDSKFEIGTIDFRNKIHGWKNFSFVIEGKGDIESGKNETIFSETFDKNAFYKGFINNLYLRPSCYDCPVKHFKSNSEITLADFWGIQKILPSFDDDRGTSLLIINCIEKINLSNDCEYVEISLDEAAVFNPNMYLSPKVHPARNKFFKIIDSQETIPFIEKRTKTGIKDKVKRIIKRCKKKLHRARKYFVKG